MNEKLRIELYIDANYARSVTNKKSTLGYCMFLGGDLVTWRSKKQIKFQAMAHGVCEFLWLESI